MSERLRPHLCVLPEQTHAPHAVAGLLAAVESLSVEDLPAALVVLSASLARIAARLTSIPTAEAGSRDDPDANLSVDEAARRLGVSPDWLYRNHRRLPFTRRIGRRLLFSARGLERWNARAR